MAANDYDMPMSPRPERTPVRSARLHYTTTIPSATGGGEAIGGGAVSVLSAPPPTSEQICLALDELLDGQYRHAKALKRLRAGWIASVCLLAAANAVAWLIRAFTDG